jgi:hypothetical protein
MMLLRCCAWQFSKQHQAGGWQVKLCAALKHRCKMPILFRLDVSFTLASYLMTSMFFQASKGH